MHFCSDGKQVYQDPGGKSSGEDLDFSARISSTNYLMESRFGEDWIDINDGITGKQLHSFSNRSQDQV